MSVFTWLLLGHLVADWMLQNDWMARNKGRRWFSAAILVHCLIYTLVLLLAFWWADAGAPLASYLPFATIIFLSHWLIDAGHLASHWMNLLRQSRLPFVQVMVDQTMHLVILAVLIEVLVQ